MLLNFVAVGLVTLSGILQVTLAPRITLLQAPADLVLLFLVAWNLQEEIEPKWYLGLMGGLILGLSSALPLWVLLLEYGLVGLLIVSIRRRVWQIPVLTLLTATLAGTFMVDSISLLYLWLTANPIDLIQILNFVLIPRVVFNMLLALPAFALISEIGKLFLPREILQ
jgi:cell shape-determining protein MreD